MYKSRFFPFYKIVAFFTLLFAISNTHAYETTDKSFLVVKLSPSWKISNTQEQSKVVKITEYTNDKNPNTEILLQTTLIKSAAMQVQNNFVSQLSQSANDLMNKNKCSHDAISNIPQISGTGNEWGIFWQCSENNLTGFMFFINGDPTTMYSLTYKLEKSYPLTASKRTNMLNILKEIQICYKNKPCAPLV